MTFHDFLSRMEHYFQEIKEEHMLFWNLWCLQYAFDRISGTYTDYPSLKQCADRLWQINDGNITFDINDFNFIRHFDDASFEALDDFKIEELAVKEFISGADIVVNGLNLAKKRYGGKAVFTIPFNIIEVIVDQEGRSITRGDGFNTPVCIRETEAQLQLSTALAQLNGRYYSADKHIYRTNLPPAKIPRQ